MTDTLPVRILRSLVERPGASCTEIQQRTQAGYNVHAVVTRMVHGGMIYVTGLSAPGPHKGGRRCKLYAPTEAGRELEISLRNPPTVLSLEKEETNAV